MGAFSLFPTHRHPWVIYLFQGPAFRGIVPLGFPLLKGMGGHAAVPTWELGYERSCEERL